ncbi:uncharacterized protein LOC110835968 [Zootermopsis nevadensis]|uniref:uncharacterized protein LOC110835968 n=1 Tax=Zootermopsis nevadensis TaxID=136037 RepID=UPI000B8E4139|nr:uncharacterized protein LOC110835968 [Zootermopsis nevadensis]
MNVPLFVLQWSGVITLCLCHLTTGSMIALERQHSNIGLVGGPYESRNANGTGDSQQRSQSSILEAVGHGIGGFVNSWLGPLASGVGSVLGGISSSLVTMTPGGPIPSPNNAIIEPFSDVTPTSVDNEGIYENPLPDRTPEFQHDDYQFEPGETGPSAISTLEPLAS